MKIEYSKKTYAGLFIIFLASFSCAYFLPVPEIVKSFAATPATAALVAAIYQILKDQAAFERQDYLQRQQQIFNLGATSHMANIAFDKHASFCEKYMGEVHQFGTDLVAHGPNARDANKHFAALIELKREYAAWLPKDIAVQLVPFENDIKDIAAFAALADDLLDAEPRERQQAIKARDDFARNLRTAASKTATMENKHLAIEEVKERLRTILGINELTMMRTMIISEAMKFLKTV